MPMMPSDFPATVAPMAGGGAPAGMPPNTPPSDPGALNQAAAVNVGVSLVHEAQTVKTALQSVLVRLRQIPGVGAQTFDRGVAMVEQGFGLIGASIQKAVPR